MTLSRTEFDGKFARRSVEIRVALERLGGYERRVRASFRVSGRNAARWPAHGWGLLSLGPAAPPRVLAGSAFTDGRDSALVVPWDRAFGGREFTFDAWVRVVDGDCGTIVSGGPLGRLSLSACGVVSLGEPGSSPTGQRRLDGAWHRIAATLDRDGARSVYIDGVLDSAVGALHEEPGEREQAPATGRPERVVLRIGSGPAGREDDRLHAYVSDVRLWRRPLGPRRLVRRTRLTGRERDLIGWWPFADSLRDRSQVHDSAGMIGTATLARATPPRRRASIPAASGRPVAPAPPPISGWDETLRIAEQPPVIDGLCRGDEYHEGSRIALEPDRSLGPRAVVAPDGLHLCTGPLLIRKASEGMTLLIGPAGGTGAPSAQDVRVVFSAGGDVRAQTGDGRGFSGPAPPGFAFASRTGRTLDLQDDLLPLKSPWFTSEILLPLPGYEIGDRLRLAVRYRGSIRKRAHARHVRASRVSGAWPRRFQALRPSSWGPVLTDPDVVDAAPIQPVSTEALAPGSAPTGLARAAGLPFGWPRSQPTVADYDSHCTAGKAAYASIGTLKWPVVDAARPLARAEGTLDSLELSNDDSPLIHGSHDLDMVMTVRPDDGWLVMNQSKPGGPAVPMSARDLVVETESAQLPDFARPAPGDHVAIVGRWIIDCGHTDPAKTEIHPTPIFESDRVEIRPLTAGGAPQPVRIAKVWFNSRPSSSFGYRFDAPFTFDVRLPDPSAGMPLVRVVEASDGLSLGSTVASGVAHITATPPKTGLAYAEIMVGAIPQRAVTPAYGAPVPWTVTLDELDVVHDSDDGGDGEWYLDVTVAGKTVTYFRNREVCDAKRCGRYAPPGGKPLSFPVLLAPDAPLLIGASGYEEDSLLVEGDRAIAEEATDDKLTGRPTPWNLGPIGKRVGAQRLCATSGWDDATGKPRDPHCDGFESSNWVLYYHVTPGGAPDPITNDTAFWVPRVADEAGELSPLPLSVPPPGGAPAIAARAGFTTERPLERSGLRLFGVDTDSRSLNFPEFAELSAITSDPRARALLAPPNSWAWLPSTLDTIDGPRDTNATLGYFGHASVTLSSTTGAVGDLAYGYRIASSYHALPLDWGERQDETATGRAVDLVSEHVRDMPWAWQHLPGDQDRYTVSVPPTLPAPAGHDPCDFDDPGTLTISTGTGGLFPDPVVATTPALSAEDPGMLTLRDLSHRLPAGGHVAVTISSGTPGRRGLYQLRSAVTPSKWLTKEECKRIHRLLDKWKMVPALTPEQLIRDLIERHGRPPGTDGPGDPPLLVDRLGGFIPLTVSAGDKLNDVIFAPADTPVSVRVVDPISGVMLAEGTNGDSAPVPAEAQRSGLVPSAQIEYDAKRSATVVLQVLPAFPLDGPAQRLQIAASDAG